MTLLKLLVAFNREDVIGLSVPAPAPIPCVRDIILPFAPSREFVIGFKPLAVAVDKPWVKDNILPLAPSREFVIGLSPLAVAVGKPWVKDSIFPLAPNNEPVREGNNPVLVVGDARLLKIVANDEFRISVLGVPVFVTEPVPRPSRPPNPRPPPVVVVLPPPSKGVTSIPPVVGVVRPVVGVVKRGLILIYRALRRV
jgi:hypothetical protein